MYLALRAIAICAQIGFALERLVKGKMSRDAYTPRELAGLIVFSILWLPFIAWLLWEVAHA